MTTTETTEETLRWRASHGDANAAAFIAEVDELRRAVQRAKPFVTMLVNVAQESPSAIGDYYSRRDIYLREGLRDIESAKKWLADAAAHDWNIKTGAAE